MKNQYFAGYCLATFCVAGYVVSVARADLVSPSTYQLLGMASAYNNVFFGDYYGRNGDIEGHAAIKGNLDIQSYSFGSGEQSQHPSSQGPTLVVGGNAKVSGATVHDGDAYISGTLTPQNGQSKWNMLGTSGTGPFNTIDPGYRGTAGTVYVGGTPDSQLDPTYQRHTDMNSILFDFTAAEDQLRRASSDLLFMDNTVTGGLVNGNYTVDLTGMSGIQVVTIDASVFNGLQNGRSIFINGGADTTLIINVSDNFGLDTLSLHREFFINGIDGSFNGDFDGSNILINTGVSQVDIGGAAINASLLALDAIVNVKSGHIDGQVFASGAHTHEGGEFHAYYTFDDSHFSPGQDSTVTPEPASCLIFSCGLFGIGYVANRRRLALKKAKAAGRV